MRKHLLTALLALAAITAGIVPFVVPAKGQFPAESTIPKDKRKGRKIPNGPSGPTPHKDGHVDLSGFWGYAGYTSDIAKDYDVGTVPMTDLGEKLSKSVRRIRASTILRRVACRPACRGATLIRRKFCRSPK